MLVGCYRCSIYSSTQQGHSPLETAQTACLHLTWSGMRAGCLSASAWWQIGSVDREKRITLHGISAPGGIHFLTLPFCPNPLSNNHMRDLAKFSEIARIVTSICSLNTHKVSMFFPRVITKSIAVTFSRSCPRYSVTRPDQFFAALAICASFWVRRGLP